MTKSTITRERLEWLSQISCRDDIEDIGGDEIRELASMALAAMDSEPVAWTWHYREQWHVTNDKCRAEFVAKDGDVAVLPLYRHAQPVPIVQMVPEEAPEHLLPKGNSRDTTYRRGAIILGWKLCRAAMLQAGTLIGEGTKQAGNSPAIPDGYVMVPKEPTKEMINARWLYYMGTKNPSSKGTYKAMLAAAPQEDINALIPLVSRDEQEGK
ncbi:hypothetical protein [Klebsiella pneumoniae]|uniref:hypothetical protein n=1 Tax=Klebsiella pneumoniae TaxID=573 RepID=UPI003B67AB62